MVVCSGTCLFTTWKLFVSIVIIGSELTSFCSAVVRLYVDAIGIISRRALATLPDSESAVDGFYDTLRTTLTVYVDLLQLIEKLKFLVFIVVRREHSWRCHWLERDVLLHVNLFLCIWNVLLISDELSSCDVVSISRRRYARRCASRSSMCTFSTDGRLACYWLVEIFCCFLSFEISSYVSQARRLSLCIVWHHNWRIDCQTLFCARLERSRRCCFKAIDARWMQRTQR